MPIAGTRVLAPFKVSVPTPLGAAVLEAAQFVTTRRPEGDAGERPDAVISPQCGGLNPVDSRAEEESRTR